MKSIRKQMSVYLIVGSLILFGVLLFISNRMVKDLPTQAKNQYSEIVSARSDEVSKEIKGLIDQVTMLSKSPIVKTMDLDQIRDYLPSLILEEKHRNFTILTQMEKLGQLQLKILIY